MDPSNPALPVFNISQGIQPGKKLVIRFTALVGLGVQPGVYWNSFQLEYEGKIVPPIPEAPVTVAGGKIGDTVWRDWNGNGVQDTGEPGFSGVTVQLFAADGTTLLRTVTTDANGCYYFTGLAEGFDYVATVDPGDAALATYFGVDPFQATTQIPQAVSGLLGNHVDADFGFWRVVPGSIGDQVFIDADGNGLYSPATDSPLSGVTVTLLRDVSPVATASTAPDGTYLFGDLGLGTYSVVVNASSMGVPSGYAPSVSQYFVNLAVGQDFLTADFPFTPLITKSVDKAFAEAGNTLNFAVNVNYTGSALLSDVTVRDFVPNGTTYQSSGQGGSLAYLNGHVYAILGNDSVQFWRYNLAANTWSVLAPFADNIGDGGGTNTRHGGFSV